MNCELTFRISLAALMIGLAAVRYYYIGWATAGFPKSDGKVSIAETNPTRHILTLSLGWLWVIVPWIYVFAPRLLEWAALPISIIVRWIGVGLGIIGIVLIGWAHRTLGKNWNVPGVIHEQQRLVMDGPYRWVRHPMYTLFAVISLALFFISANGFIAFIGLGYWLLVSTMVRVEEATLIEAFGESYRTYMHHTG